MKISANEILGSIITIVLLCIILWMVRIQTKQEYPDVTDKVVKARNMKQSVKRGRAIFLDEGCYRCHKPDKRDGFIRGVTNRVSKEWLFQFIRDEKSLIEEKDSVVLKLKENFNWVNGDHNKKHLTDKELTDILNYLESFI